MEAAVHKGEVKFYRNIKTVAMSARKRNHACSDNITPTSATKD